MVFQIKKKTSQIFANIQNDYSGFTISQAKINKIVDKIRNMIAYYYKDIYKIEDISTVNDMKNVTIDESLFLTYKNIQYWVIGIININNRQIRFEVSEFRYINILKDINKTYIKIGNIVILDGWRITLL